MSEQEVETKRWRGVDHGPSGTFAKVTLQRGDLVVRWRVKTFVPNIKDGLADAQKQAEHWLEELS